MTCGFKCKTLTFEKGKQRGGKYHIVSHLAATVPGQLAIID